MKTHHIVLLILTLSFFLVSCAHYPPDRYNTQVGAAVGAGTGALIG
jgi:PBP1b-binding outer membrane lipoprotein LpoB